MTHDTSYFDGTVSLKKTFLWNDRRLVVFADRVEYSQPERPNVPKTVIKISNITLSPIVRYHGHFEFTMFSSELGYLQRVRIRTHELNETERIHSIIQRVKMLASVPLQPPSRTIGSSQRRSSRGSYHSSHSITSDRKHHVSDSKQSNEMKNPHYLMFPARSSHVTLNMVVVLLVALTTVVAPILNSLVVTMIVVLGSGLVVTVVLNFFSIEVPSLHLIITSTPPLFEEMRDRAAVAVSRAPDREIITEELEERDSRSSSINELGYSTPIPGSPEHQASSQGEAGISVLFSESSKFVSNFASLGDYRMCYSIMWSMGDAVISLLKSQPLNIAPPIDTKLVALPGVDIDYSIKIVPDDAEYTKSEWSVIKSKNGLSVLTSKLSSTLTRWPVISAVSTVNARLDDVYKAISIPEIFKKVDEFAGSYRIIEYNELASAAGSPGGDDSVGSGSPKNTAPPNGGSKESTDEEITVDLLRPETAPLLFKHQEMKSVWPVQPRDYFALNCGFLVSLPDGRKGKFYIAKSSDPHPKDPFPTGHEGFIRGCLTASCFLLIENKDHPDTATDVWTFLHCDMKGNLSGNGKIADFITQSQMPKFFARLEAVSASCAPEMGLIK